MFDSLIRTAVQCQHRITCEQFEEWKQAYTFDALRGMTPGRSFCRHFGYQDHRLWFGGDAATVETIVIREYLA